MTYHVVREELDGHLLFLLSELFLVGRLSLEWERLGGFKSAANLLSLVGLDALLLLLGQLTILPVRRSIVRSVVGSESLELTIAGCELLLRSLIGFG